MLPNNDFDEQARIETLRTIYEAFNARDADRVLNAMTTDVNWPNAWEGGQLTGRDAVGEYWRRQWAEINPKVMPIDFTAVSGNRICVRVHQVVHDHHGRLLVDTQVSHVYAFEGGLIRSMEIEEG